MGHGFTSMVRSGSGPPPARSFDTCSTVPIKLTHGPPTATNGSTSPTTVATRLSQTQQHIMQQCPREPHTSLTAPTRAIKSTGTPNTPAVVADSQPTLHYVN